MSKQLLYQSESNEYHNKTKKTKKNHTKMTNKIAQYLVDEIIENMKK